MTLIELALLIAHFLHLAALVQAVGALVFLVLIVPRPLSLDSSGEEDRLRVTLGGIGRLANTSLFLSVAGALFWFLLQAMAMTGNGPVGWGSFCLVLSQTRFGEIFSLRFALLLFGAIVSVAVLRSARRAVPWPALAFLGPALLLQPWLGHGAAAENLFLPLATAFHVIAASVWLGALLPLWLTLRAAPLAGALATARFSRVGIVCVATIAATAVAQLPLIGDLPRLIGTPYGFVAGVKILLFAVLLAFAAVNRFVLMPRALAGGERGTQMLKASILGEAVAGLILLGAAAGLASLPPGAHEQPVWPFTIRPVPDLWSDVFLRDRIMRTLAPILLASGFLVAAFLSRRWRWLFTGAAIVAAFWTPSFPLKPYFRPAFPTTFQQWERVRSPVSLQQGAALFAADCAGCHASDARGRGPLATGRPVWPPNLTAPLYGRSRDGDLFWHVKHGMATGDGTPTMPAFHDRLDDDEIWMLVDFIRARASAVSLDFDGRWQVPTRAPAIVMTCREDGVTADTARPGTMLYLKAGVHDGGPSDDPIQDAAVKGQEVKLRTCTIGDDGQGSQWLLAMAVLAGTEPPNLARAGVLIDEQGWLRRLWLEPAARADVLLEAYLAARTPIIAADRHH
ncbi:CopD family protein [Rhizobium puerariae]|uniref:CopD family protein n=1 Tax=Rhizobium puerariae TaxID=1585791 RepID=A0ABV6AE12_9HYPH